jgi:hypothetical protein
MYLHVKSFMKRAVLGPAGDKPVSQVALQAARFSEHRIICSRPQKLKGWFLRLQYYSPLRSHIAYDGFQHFSQQNCADTRVVEVFGSYRAVVKQDIQISL